MDHDLSLRSSILWNPSHLVPVNSHKDCSSGVNICRNSGPTCMSHKHKVPCHRGIGIKAPHYRDPAASPTLLNLRTNPPPRQSPPKSLHVHCAQKWTNLSESPNSSSSSWEVSSCTSTLLATRVSHICLPMSAVGPSSIKRSIK